VLGRTNHVIITVIKDIDPVVPFSSKATGQTLVNVAAQRSLRRGRGNKYQNQSIVKEAFVSDEVPDVVSLFGKLCLRQDQFTAFKRTRLETPLLLSDPTLPQSEIVILRNELLDLPKSLVAQLVERHRIIPSRNNIVG